ncbi:MAG TPA: T9SS type A sorting domain-containing protein [Saprospiraceae bacterium]|nr:T9SS type A sorting domain-containing protein [Saprospiraceae bacterium]
MMSKHYTRFTPKLGIFILLLLLTQIGYGQICNCDDETTVITTENSSDGFESYVVNNLLPLNGNWSLYPPTGSYNPISATVVNNIVHCGNKSIRLQYSNNQPVDIRYELNGWRITLYMYVPSNKSARISFLDVNNDELTEINFGTGTTAQVTSGSFSTSFSYPKNEWFRFSSHTLHPEYTALFLNYDNVASLTVGHDTGYLNLYANETGDQFYVDKICHMHYSGALVNCSTILEPVCLNYSNIPAGNNDCYALVDGFLADEHHLCQSSGGSACDDAMPIDCGETLMSTTLGETFKFYRPDYGSCLPQNTSNDFRAPDKVFRFIKPDNTGDVGITLCSKTLNVDLDVFLVDDCGQAWSGNPQIVVNVPPNTPPNSDINCIGSGTSAVDQNGYDTDYIEYKDLPAGEYFIIVDGQHWQTPGEINDAGPFELTLTCKDLDCEFSEPITCNQPKLSESMFGENNVSVFCSPDPNPSGSIDPLPPGAGCTGVERVYQFEPNFSGPATITLYGFSSNENLELFLLEDCDHTTCLAHSTNSSGTVETITYDVIAGHTYQIVVDGYKGSLSNFNIVVNCCESPQYLNCATTGNITHYYSGDGNNLKFTFTSNTAPASGYQWLVRQNGNIINSQAGTANSTTITFNAAGNYEVCIPRINNMGCVEYCCYPVNPGNPFNCNTINYTYNQSANSYQFTPQTPGTNGQWLVDNGNNPPSPINGSLPVSGCVKRTISYRYFDGSYWRYCCRVIWICNPFSCGDIKVKYKPSNNEYEFSLDGSNSNWNSFSWTIDETSQNIGNTQNIIYVPPVPNPNDCRVFTYSLRYWDGAAWRMCCIPVYICNPENCGSNIQYTYDNSQKILSFFSANGNLSNIHWFLNGMEVNQVSVQQNGTYAAAMFYYDNSLKYYRACKSTISVPVVGTQESDLDGAVIYPNPASQKIYVQCQRPIEIIELYDLSGKLVLTEVKDNFISVLDVPRGIFFIRVYTSKGVSNHKVVLVE